VPVQRLIIGAIVIDAVGLGLNLFIGIIVSTMQELSVLPDQTEANRETHELLERIEGDLAALRKQIRSSSLSGPTNT